MEVNYLGTVRTIKLVLPDMLARQQGHIVIVSSALAVCGTLKKNAGRAVHALAIEKHSCALESMRSPLFLFTRRV